MAPTPFLDQLAAAEPTDCGIFMIRNFLSNQKEAFEAMQGDTAFPWNRTPKLFGQSLPQHAYHYERKNKKSKPQLQQYTGLQTLEQLCLQLESQFDGKISNVYCNRFQDPTHRIEWHTDTYGEHILVLSLGSERIVQFRPKRSDDIEDIQPHAGDVYFMPLRLNATHEHRVCAAAAFNTDATRLSFVFFLETPKYAQEYRITTMDRLKGAFTGGMS